MPNGVKARPSPERHSGKRPRRPAPAKAQVVRACGSTPNRGVSTVTQILPKMLLIGTIGVALSACSGFVQDFRNLDSMVRRVLSQYSFEAICGMISPCDSG